MKNLFAFSILLAAMAVFTTPATAQWSLDAEGGFQLNNTRVTGVGALLNGIPKSILTPYGRISTTYAASDKLGLRAGVGFSQKGFQLAQGLNVNVFNIPIGIGAKVATSADYVEVPLEGLYSINKGNTTLLVTAGANVGYAVGARIRPKVSVIIDFNLPKIPIDLDDDIYNRWDVSGTAGFGMIQKTSKGNLILQGRYVQSLSNFLDNPILGMKIKPYSFQFSVGYQVPLGKRSGIRA